MQLHVLGSGGYHPNESRHTSCYYLPADDVVLDAGTGMFRLPKHLRSPRLHIFLSHVHLDHVLGLTYLLVPMRTGALQETHVYGEREKLEALRENLFSTPLFPVMPSFQWHALTGPVSLPSCTVSWFGLRHPGGCVGYRIAWPDKSMCYITDTTAEPGAPYIDHIRDVNLLIHECYFDDGMEEIAQATGHSCLSNVLDVARTANAQQLLLMHVDPNRDDVGPLEEKAKTQFDAVRFAEDDRVYDF